MEQKRLFKVGDIVTFKQGFGHELESETLELMRATGSSDPYVVTGIIKAPKELAKEYDHSQIVQLVTICEKVDLSTHCFNTCWKCTESLKFLVSGCDLEIYSSKEVL